MSSEKDIWDIANNIANNPDSNPVRKWEAKSNGFTIRTDPNAPDADKEHKQAMEALNAIGQIPQSQPQADPQEQQEQLQTAIVGSKSKALSKAVDIFREDLEDRELKSKHHIYNAVYAFSKWIRKNNPNISVNQISADHIINYRKFLRNNEYNKKTGVKGLSKTTVYTRLGHVELFFRFCQKPPRRWFPDGETNLPTYNLKGDKPDAVANDTDWMKFNPTELKTIFHPDNLLDDPHNKLTPHKFWLPFLGAYTGGRLKEICYINPYDINNQNREGVWVLEFNARTKNKNSKRIVPIHPVLIDLGFIKYIEAVKKIYPDATTIFPYSSNPDKAAGGTFGRYIRDKGISSKRKVFHSFRKNIANQLMLADYDLNLRKYFTGHLTKEIHEYVYSGRRPIANLAEKLSVLEYPVDVNELSKHSHKTIKKLERKLELGQSR